MAKDNLVDVVGGPLGSTAETWLGLWQLTMQHWIDREWQDWYYHVELADLNRLAQDALQVQREWLRALRRMLGDAAASTPLALWLAAAELGVDMQSRCWSACVREAADIHLDGR